MRARDVMRRWRFKKSLEQQSPRKIVANVWQDIYPLEQYVRRNGFPDADVYAYFWEPRGNGKGIELPKWATNFQSLIGCVGLNKDLTDKSRGITAKRVFRLLEAA